MNDTKISDTLILTEHLYPYDEVKWSLIQSLISKKDNDECLFWTWELLYSKFNVKNLLYKIYLIFYNIHNHHFHNYIIKKLNNISSDNERKTIATIVSNIRILKPSFELFKIIEESKNINKRNKSITFDKRNGDGIFKKLFKSIKDKNIHKAASYLRILTKSNNVSNQDIFKFIREKFKINKLSFLWSKKINKSNDFNILLLIVYRYINKKSYSNSNIKKKYISVRNSLLDELNLLFDNDKQTSIDKWKNTKHIRKYKTHHYYLHQKNNIYGRYQIDISSNLKFECCNNWLFYCQNTKSWKERINKYNITFKDKIPIFQNNDINDDFHDKFDYELDEQSLDTQNKSIRDIKLISLDKWIDFYNYNSS